ncbi:MAG: hypothetical protein Q8O14_05085 [bacterium]|jgi:hypothetical protein|nr:hypothetical protein [bacterium]
MSPILQHLESRRLLRDAAWVAALAALLWSPLPEIILGHWLQLGNAGRPETGRAHDRLDLLQESDSQAVVRSTVIEHEKVERARVVTLGQMRQHLTRNPELDMGLAAFREFYGSLTAWQQDQIIPPDDLSHLTRRGLAQVLVTRHGPHARFAFLDESHNRLAGAEADLLQLQVLPLGLSPVAPADTAEALRDPALAEVGSGQEEAGLVPGHRELLKRLRLLPGLAVARVWQVEGRIVLLEVAAAGRRQWLRPAGVAQTYMDKNGRELGP